MLFQHMDLDPFGRALGQVMLGRHVDGEWQPALVSHGVEPGTDGRRQLGQDFTDHVQVSVGAQEMRAELGHGGIGHGRPPAVGVTRETLVLRR
jgi:hypothetical protein